MTNGWPEWQRYVLAELARLRETTEEIRALLSEQEVEITRLRERFRVVTTAYTLIMGLVGIVGTVVGIVIGRL